MHLSPSEIILRMFSYGQRLLFELSEFCYYLFTTTLGEYAEIAAPLLGQLPPGMESWGIFGLTLLELLLFSIPLLVVVTLIKWFIDIIF